MYKKKELQLSYFSICEGKKLDDKIVTYFALKAGSTVHLHSSRHIPRTHGHQVFIVLYCSYQETSAKLNDLISKK